MTQNPRDKIFNVKNNSDFHNAALQVFDYQFNSNTVYQDFTRWLKINPEKINNLTDFPFLPVEFFRNHKVVSGDSQIEKIFESSGTTGSITSRHFVSDLSLYTESFIRTFRMFYGEPGDYMIAALLPSYTERENSSLVYMADALIKMSGNKLSGFYRENQEELIQNIISAREYKSKVLLLGVSFALLDLAEKNELDLSGIIIMETGGMKGRRKEMTRSELHSVLKKRFNVPEIHSEYGMTELLSQA
jgi:phenylacetate-coenzyme A ligase PaaK-like adenylate-forming protein